MPPPRVFSREPRSGRSRVDTARSRGVGFRAVIGLVAFWESPKGGREPPSRSSRPRTSHPARAQAPDPFYPLRMSSLRVSAVALVDALGFKGIERRGDPVQIAAALNSARRSLT